MTESLREEISKYIRSYYFHDSKDIARSDSTAAHILKDLIIARVKGIENPYPNIADATAGFKKAIQAFTKMLEEE